MPRKRQHTTAGEPNEVAAIRHGAAVSPGGSPGPELFDLGSHTISRDRLNELLRLFPEARTECGSVDFNRLRLAIGESVETGRERYGLTWPGKADCIKAIQSPSLGTLLPAPEESENWHTTENLIIEGDNFEILKLLQKSYLGKVKLIYIDPPYNTGNDFIYPDDYSESLQSYLEYTGQIDSSGKKFSTNADTQGRFHSKWLSMMYPRLYLARNLLRDDGTIFVSIDENEYAHLRILMSEIFGEECFVASIVVLCNPKGRSQDKYFATNHEYVLVFSKTPQPKGTYSVDKGQDQIAAEYPEEDEGGKFRFLELRNTHREFGKHNRRNLFFPLYVDDAGTVSLDRVHGAERVLPVWDDGFEGCWTWDRGRVRSYIDFLVGRKIGGKWKVFRKSYASGAERMLKTILADGSFSTERGQREFNSLFKTRAKIFQSPKSPHLLAHLIQTCTTGSDLILDFFAGSGTTAQAVLEQNRADGGTRRFVLVQLPEPTPEGSEARRAGYSTVSAICLERLRRVLSNIHAQLRDVGDIETNQSQDLGFRVYKLGESNFKVWDSRKPEDAEALQQRLSAHVVNVRSDRKEADILTELLIKSGFPLTSLVHEISVGGKKAYTVMDGKMLICLDRQLTLEAIRGIADLRPERVVCLDEGFAGNDQLKVNAGQTFRTQGVTNFQTV